MPRSMVTKRFINPRAQSSALALLGTLQPRALGFLNCLLTLFSVSNLYVVIPGLVINPVMPYDTCTLSPVAPISPKICYCAAFVHA